MIFIFGSEFFTALGMLLLILLLMGGAVAEWIVHYSVGIGIVLFLCWIVYAYRTVVSIHARGEGHKFSLVLGLLHTVPQIAVIASGYYYFTKLYSQEGAVSSVLDIIICFGVYAMVTAAWNKLVVQDKVAKWAAVVFSILHLGISIFFVVAFLIYQ